MPAHKAHDARSLHRRHVYVGEGLMFEIASRGTRWLEAEAIDLTPEGVGLAVVLAADADAGGRRGRHGPLHGPRRVRRHPGRQSCGTSAACGPAGRTLPRIGLSLVADRTSATPASSGAIGVRYPCPDALPAFATASCPWFFRETLRFRIVELGAGGMTLRTRAEPGAAPPGGARLRAAPRVIGVEHGRGRLTSVRRNGGDFEVGVAWIDPPRALLEGAVALPPGGRRHPDARDAARRWPRGRERRPSGHLRLRHDERRLRGDPRLAPACPSGRGPPRQPVDRRPALAVRRALPPSHLPVRRADRRLRARDLRRRRPARSQYISWAATRSRSGCGRRASSRAARARRIRTSSAPACTSH